jgi:hypothetical protein
MSVSRAVPDRKEIARTFLRLASAQYQEHRQHRAYYARIAREHGLTNQDIADEYGVTEAAVRQMIQRAAEPSCPTCNDRPRWGHYCADCGAHGAGMGQ